MGSFLAVANHFEKSKLFQMGAACTEVAFALLSGEGMKSVLLKKLFQMIQTIFFHHQSIRSSDGVHWELFLQRGFNGSEFKLEMKSR